MKAYILSLTATLLILTKADAQTTIFLDGKDSGRVFEGIGAVSAGASSRNLIDYPEKQRNEVLDLLFKPKFGAGLQHLKVEIGSGENSTCGSEPSHAITKEEVLNPKARGYEFWLMSEARKRNANIILDCLPWAYPQWVDNRFSQSSADYIVSFLELARKNFGIEVDWVSAAQNEMGMDINWVVKNLRPTMDAHGFSKVKLQGPDDDSEYWQVFDELERNAEANKLINAVGYHYVDGRDPWDIDQINNHPVTDKAKNSGKALWASEEWSQSGKEWGGVGALYLARLMNKVYTRDRITKYEIWSPFDGIYDQIIWPSTGALQADSPWDGSYTVWPAVWALAHTTQFAEPGWVYMDHACGQFDSSTWKGSYVGMRNPKTSDWSIIMVTGEKKKVKINIGQGLKNKLVYIWKSTEKQQFIRQKPLKLVNSLIEVELEANSIYTVTSTTGQTKGVFERSPAKKPFPMPFRENFEAYHEGLTAKYFSDQKGTFEVEKYSKGGMCLTQIVPEQGILWYNNWLLKPHTLFGDVQWDNYAIEADVLLTGGDVEIGGRYNGREQLGYRLILTRDGRWQLNYQYLCLATGQILDFKPAEWHHLRLEMNGSQILGKIDGIALITVLNTFGVKGMAVLASTYDRNKFDNILIEPLLVKQE